MPERFLTLTVGPLPVGFRAVDGICPDHRSVAFIEGTDPLIVVSEKGDQSLQRLLYTNSDDDPNAWVFADKFPVVLTR